MKKLSDYEGEQAIELWSDLMNPISSILKDKDIKEVVTKGKPKIEIAKTILRNHSKEATEILLRIDPEPINGLNIVLRLILLLAEIGSNPEIKSFFGFAEQAKTDAESSGSHMENTEEEEK